MEALRSVLPIVGWSAAGVLALGWLVVSFTKPGHARTRVEWLSALAMYVVILCIMANGLLRFGESSLLLGLTFGVLVVVFGAGTITTLVFLLRELAGSSGKGASSDATH